MPEKKNGFKLFYAVSLAAQLGFLIAFPIAGFILLGILGDRMFGTSPLLLAAGGLIGAAATVYEVYHFLVPLIKDDKDEND